MAAYEKVIVYIDGFNLYFGMKQAGLQECKWLDLSMLISKLLRENQHVLEIKYFTSNVSKNPSKQKRQVTYIDALKSKGIKVIYGQYQNNVEECMNCGNKWLAPKEKMTDVNIATEMLQDAFLDKYDMAMLISGDSDLIPPIRAIHNNFKNKRVFVAFPPERFNSAISIESKGNMIIGKKNLKSSQFEDVVISVTGYPLKKPAE